MDRPKKLKKSTLDEINQLDVQTAEPSADEAGIVIAWSAGICWLPEQTLSSIYVFVPDIMNILNGLC